MESELTGSTRLQPVREGDEMKLSVRGTGSKGNAYGTYMGLVIFVVDLKKWTVGEQIQVRITKVLDKCAFAEKV